MSGHPKHTAPGVPRCMQHSPSCLPLASSRRIHSPESAIVKLVRILGPHPSDPGSSPGGGSGTSSLLAGWVHHSDSLPPRHSSTLVKWPESSACPLCHGGFHVRAPQAHCPWSSPLHAAFAQLSPAEVITSHPQPRIRYSLAGQDTRPSPERTRFKSRWRKRYGIEGVEVRAQDWRVFT